MLWCGASRFALGVPFGQIACTALHTIPSNMNPRLQDTHGNTPLFCVQSRLGSGDPFEQEHEFASQGSRVTGSGSAFVMPFPCVGNSVLGHWKADPTHLIAWVSSLIFCSSSRFLVYSKAMFDLIRAMFCSDRGLFHSKVYFRMFAAKLNRISLLLCALV